MAGGKIYETIIIGAGPAGLTAERYLEDGLILDKKKEIGNGVSKQVKVAPPNRRSFLFFPKIFF